MIRMRKVYSRAQARSHLLMLRKLFAIIERDSVALGFVRTQQPLDSRRYTRRV